MSSHGHISCTEKCASINRRGAWSSTHKGGMRSGFLKQVYNVVRNYTHTHNGCESDVKGMLWNHFMHAYVCSCEHLHAHQCLFIAHLNSETAINSHDRDLHLGRDDINHSPLPRINLKVYLSPSPALKILNGKPQIGKLPSHSMPSSFRLTRSAS